MKQLDTHMYMNEWTLISKWTADLNVRAKTIKILEGNIGIKHYDLGLGKSFLDMTSDKRKIGKLLQNKKTCLFQKIIKEVKRQSKERELLDHMVILHLTFWGTIILFSKVAAPFNIPTSRVWVF